MKAKKLREALQQMAEEGVVQLFVPQDGSGAIVGVVGALQLDVLKERLQAEYGLPIDYEPTRFTHLPLDHGGRAGRTRQVHRRAICSSIARDLDGAPGLHGAERLPAPLRGGALAKGSRSRT